MQTSPIFAPAYALEHLGYYHKFQNPVLNEIVPRVVALAAPFFYAAQIGMYFTFSALDFLFAQVGGSPGHLAQLGYIHMMASIRNLVSSILEIPEKVIFGAHHTPNYFETPDRYSRKDLSLSFSLF